MCVLPRCTVSSLIHEGRAFSTRRLITATGGFSIFNQLQALWALTAERPLIFREATLHTCIYCCVGPKFCGTTQLFKSFSFSFVWLTPSLPSFQRLLWISLSSSAMIHLLMRPSWSIRFLTASRCFNATLCLVRCSLGLAYNHPPCHRCCFSNRSLPRCAEFESHSAMCPSFRCIFSWSC